MKKIIAIIEKASDGGYGIYCPELKGVSLYGHGLTWQPISFSVINYIPDF